MEQEIIKFKQQIEEKYNPIAIPGIEIDPIKNPAKNPTKIV